MLVQMLLVPGFEIAVPTVVNHRTLIVFAFDVSGQVQFAGRLVFTVLTLELRGMFVVHSRNV